MLIKDVKGFIVKIAHRTFVTISLLSLINLGALTSFNAHADWLTQGSEALKQIQNLPGANPANPTNATANSTLPSGVSNSDLQSAFKQALTQGSETVVKQLGAADGFNKDPKIHIALPGSLKTVQTTLRQLGMGKTLDDLELKINRAAEAAAPQAKTLFINAIQEMKFEDVKKIYSGGQDSATQYLKSKTAAKLKTQMTPIVAQSLNQVGALQTYDNAIASYKSVPFVPDVKNDLQNHVLDQSLNGLFYYLAQEEQAIRQDPLKQTTSLLKKVFGQ